MDFYPQMRCGGPCIQLFCQPISQAQLCHRSNQTNGDSQVWAQPRSLLRRAPFYGFICLSPECRSTCPVDCLSKHKERFICHNRKCKWHDPTSQQYFLPGEKQQQQQQQQQQQEEEEEDDHGKSKPKASQGYGSYRASTVSSDEHCELVNERVPVQLPVEREILGAKEKKRKEFVREMGGKRMNLRAKSGRPCDAASITEVTRGLFVGDSKCVGDAAGVLRHFGIMAVVSIVSDGRDLPDKPCTASSGLEGLQALEKMSIRNRMIIRAEDANWTNVFDAFEGASDFIEKHLHPAAAAHASDTDARSEQEKVQLPQAAPSESKGARILVHCATGNSRSVTIVAAYLMRKRRWGAYEALRYIQSRRPAARLNDSFIEQLLLWQDLAYTPWVNRQWQSRPPEYAHMLRRLQDYKRIRHIKEALGRPVQHR